MSHIIRKIPLGKAKRDFCTWKKLIRCLRPVLVSFPSQFFPKFPYGNSFLLRKNRRIEGAFPQRSNNF